MKAITRGLALLLLASMMTGSAASARNTILVNRLGPSGSELFIANADGSGERTLFSAAAFDYDASFSPDGKWIVFTSERNGLADIYRVRPDRSGLEQLTSNSGFNDAASLSPDGRQMAFVSTRGSGSPNIWILDLKTRSVRSLTNTRGPIGNYRPAWSPDGKWIAFSSDRSTEVDRRVKMDHVKGRWEHSHALSLYVMQPDGKGLRRLTAAGTCTGSPKWSSDGRQIVFYEVAIEDTFTARVRGGPTSQIVSVDFATGARQERTSGPGLKVSPQFLDAGRIGYLAKAGPADHGGLAFTTGERGPDGWIRNPSWSPDGKSVVYQKFTYASRQNQPMPSTDPEFALRFSGEFPAVSRTGRLALSPLGEPTAQRRDAVALSVADVDGGNARKIFSDPTGGGAMAFSPAWSPDGQWIAFGFGGFFTNRDKPARLMMIRPDGSGSRDLAPGPHNSGFPSWSPDGKRIVYRVWSEQERGLRILNVDDGVVTKLTTDYDNFPFWSPKGDRICFTRPLKEAFDVFTIRPDGTDLRQLTDAPGNDAHCAWSPDSQTIMFSSARFGFRDEAPLYDGAPQPYAELFVMNADGSGQRAITDDKWEQGTPAWVPNALARPARTESSRR